MAHEDTTYIIFDGDKDYCDPSPKNWTLRVLGFLLLTCTRLLDSFES